MLLAATLINRARSWGLIDVRYAPIGTNACEKHRRQDALNEVMSCLPLVARRPHFERPLLSISSPAFRPGARKR